MISNLLRISLWTVRGLEAVTVTLIWIFMITIGSFMSRVKAKEQRQMTKTEKVLMTAVLNDSIMELIRKYCFWSTIMICAELVHFAWFEEEWLEPWNYYFQSVQISCRLQLTSVVAPTLFNIINSMI